MGYNSRLDDLQAAVLSVKLKQLDNWNDQRRGFAAQYDAGPEGHFAQAALCRSPAIGTSITSMWSRPKSATTCKST